ncbi:hypothetical protein ACFL2S_11840 [Thermodesulfobacteriota bacterium]
MDKFDQAIRVGDQVELRSKENSAFLETERVFGGICPASEGSPFYACCLCQIPHANKAGKKKLIFLGEVENELPEPFFDQLVELSRSFFSWHWYYNSSDADDNAIDSLYPLLRNYTRARDITQITLAPALTLNWNTGILTIQQWVSDEALEIAPGTVLAAQLGKMTVADRQASRRKVFYAPDALRALMGHASQNLYRRNYASETVDYYFG